MKKVAQVDGLVDLFSNQLFQVAQRKKRVVIADSFLEVPWEVASL